MDETKRLREAVKEVHDLLNSHDGVECNANIIGMLSKNRELEKQAQLWQDQALDYYGKLTLWQRRTLSYIHGIRQYESLVTHLIHATAAAGLADVVTPEAQKHRLEFLRLVKKDIAELPSTTVPATHVADDEPAIDPDKCKDETNGKGEDWPLPPYTAPPSKPPAQVHTATDGTKQEEPDDYGHH